MQPAGMGRSGAVFLFALVGTLGAAELLLAQGPPGGGFFFNPDEMLQRVEGLDANKNGVLEPSEVEGRARYMVEGIARGAGLDTSKPIPLDKLKEAMRQRFQRGPGGPGPGDGRDNSSAAAPPSSSAKVVAPTVLAFGTDVKLQPPPGFGKPIDGPSMDELAKKFDRGVMERVAEKFRENDKNKNGLLESDEWPGLSSRSNPKDWDKDKNGILTRLEVAEHYASYSSSRYGSSSSSGGPPGGFFGGPGGPFGGGGGMVVVSSSGGSSSSSSTSSNPESRIQSYADSLLKQYDDNKDGVLQEAEWSKMRSEHHAADKNGDKLITRQELFERLASSNRGSGGSGGGSSFSTARGGASKSAERKSYRALTPTERLPKGLPSWFTRNDANEDGQVSMAEFSTAWSDAKVSEFLKYDLNGDGLITAKECLAAENAASSK